MKLELKHLAGYLPYGLKFKTPIGILILNQINNHAKYKLWFHFKYKAKSKFEKYNYENVSSNDYCGKGYVLSEVKPILRPLSDLTKEIEINGEKFTPTDIINKDFFWDYVRNNMRDLIKDKSYILVGYLPALVVDKLLEWHFDIHGLIENNLAIDINTL